MEDGQVRFGACPFIKYKSHVSRLMPLKQFSTFATTEEKRSAYVNQGIEQGVKKEKMSLAQTMIEEKEPVGKISKYIGFAVDKLKEIAAAMGRTLV